jgi:transposase
MALVMQVGDLLRPIVGAMRQELLGGSYLQADETTVGVQMHDGRGQNHQAYLWQYGQPGGSVVFDFRLGRERDGPKRFLGDFAAGCKATAMGPTIRWAAKAWCTWPALAHARRKFFDAVKLNARDETSIRIVAQMDALFAIDAEARAGGLTQAARHGLRLQNAPPLLEQLKVGIEAARAGALPQSALAKACNYTLTLWGRLSLCALIGIECCAIFGIMASL